MPAKRKNKSKEEIIAEAKAQKEVNRLRLKARDEFYPHLVKNTKTIEEAKTTSMAYYLSVERAFTALKDKMTIKELDMRKHLNDSPESKKWHEFFDMFEDETIATMTNIVQSMPEVIDSFIKEEMKGRSLDTLKTYFLDPHEEKSNGTNS